MKKYRRRKNPIVTLGASGVLVIAAGIAAFIGWKWWQKNKQGVIDAVTPKSTAEKTVDSLYGPSQAWKTNPVYNTPGTPGYLPGLPASYPPGTAAQDMPVPPGVSVGYTPAPSIMDRIKSIF